MISLPTECLFTIFDNLQTDYESLFSCLLVNREWCRIIVPILWSEPTIHFSDIRLIKIFLLMLNAKEQALLIPFKINLPNYQKLLFDYTSYTVSIGYGLHNGIVNYLLQIKQIENRMRDISVITVKCSLIAMFLRTSKKLKYLKTGNIIYNRIILENLCQNTTVISMDYSSNDDSEFEVIEAIAKILCKNTTLTSLNLIGGKALTEALCKNTTLTYLNVGLNQIDSEEE
ncbi:f-box domain-containing protein [Gigaspora margarita]|uniref:F-box domain-containing protein n=1 Tax=Gigaspora margarita TaxID=4874 RepID=A0A8H4ASI6_GIGMA|nr:f-box domain-containing protein [Gigaspora margarita]